MSVLYNIVKQSNYSLQLMHFLKKRKIHYVTSRFSSSLEDYIYQDNNFDMGLFKIRLYVTVIEQRSYIPCILKIFLAFLFYLHLYTFI